MDKFTEAYVEAALWSSVDDDDDPLDDNYDASDLAPETLAQIEDDCKAFQEAHPDAVTMDAARAGHDFWLTRNGHGAGFWDGGWPEPLATVLTDAAHVYGEVNLYVGDDGLIHQS